MRTRIEHQIIRQNGKPAFAVLPYVVFLELAKSAPALKSEKEEALFPHKVVELNCIQGKSLLRAWREYLGLSQAEVAEKAGMTQAALSQLEKPDARPKKATLKKLAAALDLQIEQLQE